MKKINKSKLYMKNDTSEHDYDEIEISDEDLKKAHEFRKKRMDHWKRPTTVSLDQKDIDTLKKMAEHDGIPYQTLMRSLIKEGIRRKQKKKMVA